MLRGLPADLTRRAVAVHECGHRAAAGALDERVAGVRIWGEDAEAHGVTRVDVGTPRTPEEVRRMLLIFLAGHAAEDRWLEEHRLEGRPGQDDSSDMQRYRKLLASPRGRAMDDAALRVEVRRLIVASWSEIVRLSAVLDRRGRL